MKDIEIRVEPNKSIDQKESIDVKIVDGWIDLTEIQAFQKRVEFTFLTKSERKGGKWCRRRFLLIYIRSILTSDKYHDSHTQETKKEETRSKKHSQSTQERKKGNRKCQWIR